MTALPTSQSATTQHRPASRPLEVYFDGACPLCAREIAFYRRRRGADGVKWVDLREIGAAEAAPGLSCFAALQRFHVRTPEGAFKSGAAAFAALWQALPAFRLAGRIAAWPPVTRLLEYGYRGFLRIRPAISRWLSRG